MPTVFELLRQGVKIGGQDKVNKPERPEPVVAMFVDCRNPEYKTDLCPEWHAVGPDGREARACHWGGRCNHIHESFWVCVGGIEYWMCDPENPLRIQRELLRDQCRRDFINHHILDTHFNVAYFLAHQHMFPPWNMTTCDAAAPTLLE